YPTILLWLTNVIQTQTTHSSVLKQKQSFQDSSRRCDQLRLDAALYGVALSVLRYCFSIPQSSKPSPPRYGKFLSPRQAHKVGLILLSIPSNSTPPASALLYPVNA